MKLSYTTKLICSNEIKSQLLQVLELERDMFNYCSNKFFGQKEYSIKNIHNLCYYALKSKFSPKSQFAIKAEQSCLAAYRSIRSNKQKLTTPPIKKKLSIQLDKRICTLRGNTLILTTLDHRVKCTFEIYPRLKNMLDKYTPKDPKLFCRNGELYITLVFDVLEPIIKRNLALGVDLGYRRYAATSEGKLFIDKEYNKSKRKIRYLKRCLQSKNTQSSNRHLRKLKNKEKNQSKDFNHKLANAILKTKANVIVLENLNVQKMKKKRHPGKSRSRKGQVGLSVLKVFLTYKAALLGKEVVCVNPKNTSQVDCVYGKKGMRRGCRFYAQNGLVYDADVNAAINIAKRSKLPVSQGNPLDGQAVINQSIVGPVLQTFCFSGR